MFLSLLWFTTSDYLFGILWQLSCLSFDLRLLITSLVSCGHCLVCLRFTASDYLLGILWPLFCLSFDSRLLITTSLVSCGHCLVSPLIYASDYLFGILCPLSCLSLDLRLLITSLVSCGHCLVSPLIHGFWLPPLWYLVAIVLFLLWITASDYLFGILWPLSCLSFDLRLLITSLLSCGYCLVCP
jgi:hypothetical protein